MRRTRAVAVALTIAMALLGAACGGSDEREAPRNPTTTLSPTTLSQAQRDERAVRAAAEGFERAALRLSMDPSYDLNVLDRYLAEPLLSGIRANYVEMRSKNLQGRRGPDSRAMYRIDSVSVQGDEAILRECTVDDGQLIDRDTGAVVDDRVTTAAYRTTARRIQGAWKLVGRDTVQTWEGVTGCAGQG